MLHMIPAQQPQMYQQPAQTMPAPLANIGQPMHQLASTKSNRGWILAGGFHVVYMVSLLVLSLVYAMFDPAPDWVGDGGFGDQLFYSMSDSTFYLLFPAFVITLISALMAIQAECNKLFVVFLPAISQLACTLLWMVIVVSIYPDADFSEAWEELFGVDFFENVIPELISHIALCVGMVALHKASSND